jgi:hypothetical protein
MGCMPAQPVRPHGHRIPAVLEMSYQYRGSKHDVPAGLSLVTAARPQRKTSTFNRDKCGTKAGFRQHQNHAVTVCPDCQEAQADYMRAYYQARRAA